MAEPTEAGKRHVKCQPEHEATQGCFPTAVDLNVHYKVIIQALPVAVLWAPCGHGFNQPTRWVTLYQPPITLHMTSNPRFRGCSRGGDQTGHFTLVSSRQAKPELPFTVSRVTLPQALPLGCL